MRFRLLVVGRGSGELAGYEKRLTTRLAGMAGFEVIELAEARAKGADGRRREEARRILDRARKGFILFDERGEQLASREWAAAFSRLPGGARQDFVIGGADGVADEVRAAAGRIWSLSRLTLPHQLARTLVIEQIYRAFTIMRGHPYHRD